MGRNNSIDDNDIIESLAPGCVDSMEYMCFCGPLWDCILDDDDDDLDLGTIGEIIDDNHESITTIMPFLDNRPKSIGRRIRDWNARRIAAQRQRRDERRKRREERAAAAASDNDYGYDSPITCG